MIFVDADACPVKEEISQIAKDLKLEVFFIASYYHKPSTVKEGDNWTFVDPDREACDLYILNHAKRGDILVTQDIGLASLALQKGVYVFSPRGTEYKEETIDTALDFRYLAAKDRERGKFWKGPKPFKDEDRHRFLAVFDNFCRKMLISE
ncbi:YaiI/YqxD family protein [Siminovitchia fortis]|uniref:YaiI/YqxD family protein n=1 Tax=Siminovitchia fortis TaxID=254758 RepID=UPI001F45BD20|nr:DUF188 domain-containing protein [Siminovitchia fortis]WHY82718.1 DUF188 domain-containing protein [Siminovitchia fortis]